MTIHEMIEGKNPLSHLNSVRILIVLGGTSSKWQKTLTSPKSYTRELNYFLEECLIEDGQTRKSPEILIQHPFILRYSNATPEKMIAPLLKPTENPKTIFQNNYRKLGKKFSDIYWKPEPDTTDRIVLAREQSNNIGIAAANLKKLVERSTNGESNLQLI